MVTSIDRVFPDHHVTRTASAMSPVGLPVMVGAIVDATGSSRPAFLIAAGVLAANAGFGMADAL